MGWALQRKTAERFAVDRPTGKIKGYKNKKRPLGSGWVPFRRTLLSNSRGMIGTRARCRWSSGLLEFILRPDGYPASFFLSKKLLRLGKKRAKHSTPRVRDFPQPGPSEKSRREFSSGKDPSFGPDLPGRWDGSLLGSGKGFPKGIRWSPFPRNCRDENAWDGRSNPGPRIPSSIKPCL